MNTRKIRPIQFWRQSGTSTATDILLYNFHGYNFDGTDSAVSYRIGFLETVTGPDGETPIERWTSLSEGSVIIPNSIVQAWGEDDEPIFDYVMEELNLEYESD